MEKVQSETWVGAMTPEQILELAKEHDMIDSRGNWSFDLIPFALAVAQRTRDECAEKFEEMQSNGDAWVSTVAASAAIRSMTND